MYSTSFRGSIASKIDLKIEIVKLAHEMGADFDTLMGKFQEEYEALPMTIHEKNQESTQGFMDQIFDRVQGLTGLGLAGHQCGSCGGHEETPGPAPEPSETPAQ